MLALRDHLNDAMSCDSLTFGGNSFQSLLARRVCCLDYWQASDDLFVQTGFLETIIY